MSSSVFAWTPGWVLLLAVCTFSAAQHETLSQNCSTKANQLLAALEEKVVECGENLSWSSEDLASVLLSTMKLKDLLQKQQLKDCQGAQPKECPEPKIPQNGGLVCVTAANRRYCKPLCNNGFDFAFLRRSRLYDECSERTKYKWDSQYVGGNTLAVCSEALLQISGAKTAYFPENQTCLTTKSSSQHQSDVIRTFIKELADQSVHAESQDACLVCGEQ
ncbi:uncharacterized protein si:ch1073-126c3.2 isoform X1 [Takifugu flavidus]|uniref:uncharacterized protein si:ch1073-126c3.2 isoform X1 n=1 Tax=Takifugu flavidus TaxID=433684 RepID=UPI002544B193|nr:uncharacterized protein si:ch1073-126c3.2 isoform X1 [Takifugu flavidus]